MHASIQPDLCTCKACLAELLDPTNRRYRYPFTSCHECGPRFSIMESTPFERARSSMHRFTPCAACQSESLNPASRRFHDPCISCPNCGPSLAFWNRDGKALVAPENAFAAAAEALRLGSIVAVKSTGGFQLVVDGFNDDAVKNLQKRTSLLLRAPTMMVDFVSRLGDVSECERTMLQSPAAPVVLLDPRRLRSTNKKDPHTSRVILPYSSLFHLLLRECGGYLALFDGFVSDEPLPIDEGEALERLGSFADYFLVDDLPILRPVGHSVARAVMDEPMFLRRGRGMAPMPIHLAEPCEPMMAVGGQSKSTIAIAAGRYVAVSPHVGDLEAPSARAAHEALAHELPALLGVTPRCVACDLHPDYTSTHVAHALCPSPIHIQHHHAHVVACMAEHRLTEEVLGVCWDGTGYGPDHTIWGGEFLRVTPEEYQRAAHLKSFALPGGTKAVREPRRSAMGVLYEIYGRETATLDHLPTVRTFNDGERDMLMHMLREDFQSPHTTSMGRLFDAVASLLDLCHVADEEGQAAGMVEALSGDFSTAEPYPYHEDQPGSVVVLDWRPMIAAVLDDCENRVGTAQICARFHRTLVDMILDIAAREGLDTVVLTGGCFQNVALLEGAVRALRAAGFDVYWPQQLPPNDGGLSVGQAVAAGVVIRVKESHSCV